METILSSQKKWTILFIFICAGIIAVEYYVTFMPQFYEAQSLLPFAVSFDLLVVLPVLFYFLVVRSLKLSVSSVVFAFVAALGLGYLILPASHQYYLGYAEGGLILAELGLLLYTIIKIRKIITEYKRLSVIAPDFVKNLYLAFQRHLGMNVFVNFLAGEISMLRYGLFFWLNKKESKNTEQDYSIHKNSGFVVLFSTLLFVTILETVVLHILLSFWNSVIAIVFSVLSIYTFIFLLAYMIAIIRRKISIDTENLHIRIGILWNFEIKRNNILDIEKIKEANPSDKTQLNTSSYLLTSPNVLIRLKNPIKVSGIYGLSKTIQSLCLQVDDLERFIGEMNKAS